jgi:fumarate reductase (CoM/CoB) subunit A
LDTVETDILVIGGGGAGAYAAYEASKRGGSITLVAKGFLGRSGSTPMALGAIAGVGPWKQPQDSKDIHFMDTLKGGAFLNEGRLVRIMVEESPKRILELEELGAFWERSDDGEAYLLRQGGGHSFPRSPYVEDRPGHELIKVLKGELLRRNVRLMENQMVLKILTNDGRVCGAISMGVHTGEFTLYKAKAIVLATGGASQIYPYFTQDVRNTGDGFCLGIEAGADLMDMEFLQFFLGLSWPEAAASSWVRFITAVFSTAKVNGSYSGMIRRGWNSLPETSCRGPAFRRCRRGGGHRMEESIWIYPTTPLVS